MNVFSLPRFRAVRESVRCGKSAGVAIAEAKSLAARMRHEWFGGAS